MTAKPEIQPIWLACKACGHAWDDWQLSRVSVDAWIAHVKTHRCPQCGKGYDDHTLLLRQKPITR